MKILNSFSITISKHEYLADSHLDIFIEQKEYLKTYSCNSDLYKQILDGHEIEVIQKNPHRKIYLNYSGEISNQRGNIQILWQGKCLNEKEFFSKKMYMQKLNDSLIRFY